MTKFLRNCLNQATHCHPNAGHLIRAQSGDKSAFNGPASKCGLSRHNVIDIMWPRFRISPKLSYVRCVSAPKYKIQNTEYEIQNARVMATATATATNMAFRRLRLRIQQLRLRLQTPALPCRAVSLSWELWALRVRLALSLTVRLFQFGGCMATDTDTDANADTDTAGATRTADDNVAQWDEHQILWGLKN